MNHLSFAEFERLQTTAPDSINGLKFIRSSIKKDYDLLLRLL